MNKTSVTTGGGLTLLEVLFVVFLVLKLTGKTVVATWSWWWVTAPLWIGFAIIFAIFFISFLIIGLSWLIKRKR